MPTQTGRIREEELAYYKNDYAISKEKKVNRLHTVWWRIMQEYRFSYESYWTFYDRLVDSTNVPVALDDQLRAVDGRVGSLHVFVRKLKALMALQNPDVLIEPSDPGEEPIAYLLEKAFATLQEEIQCDRKFRRMLVDAACFGTSVAKCGYLSEFVYGETPMATKIPANAVEDPREDAYPSHEVAEYSDLTLLRQTPNLQIVKPHDIFLDIDARTLSEVRRIYHRSSRVLRDVQEDSRYSEEFREKFSVACRSPEDDSAYPTMESDFVAEMRRGDIVECFDIATRQYCVFSPNVDVPARDWKILPLDIDNPYIFFQPIPDPESPWGIPYALTIYSQCQAKNAVSARIVDTISRHGKRVRLATRELTPDTVSSIMYAKDGDVVHAPELDSQTAMNAMVPLDLGNVDPEVLQLRNQIDEDLRFMSGISDQTSNLYGAKDETATAVQTRVQSQGLSIDDMRAEYESAIEDILINIFKIQLQYWPETKMIKYVGHDPYLYFWVPLMRDRVRNHFTLKVRVGSTQKISPEVRRRQIIDATPRLIELDKAIVAQKQMMAQGLYSGINLEEWARELMEELVPGLSDKVMNRRDPVTLLSRLVSQNIAWPTNVAPELLNQLALSDPPLAEALGGGVLPPLQPAIQSSPNMGVPTPMPPPPPQMGPPQMPSFEEANRIPAQPTLSPFGQIPMDTGAGISGRMLSEAMNV